MAFPTPTEYQEAMQNPHFYLSDAVLKKLKPRVSPTNGMPQPLSGGFSTIFILQGEGFSYALKCYNKDIQDLEKRYQAISKFLKEQSIKDFMSYEYQPEAIYIKNQWWPALKMEYIKGKTINAYIENNLDNPNNLYKLREEFSNLIKKLEKARIAHGDIQHGNILVDSSGTLRLIDYDGMYTPNMSFKSSHEIGHENFQHPDRSETDFNDKIDRFSTIVIDLSLEALIKKSNLWDYYYNGENLILKRDDFENPESSEALREIQRIEGMEQKVKDFSLLCHLNMEKIPSLNEWRSVNYNFTGQKTFVNKEVEASSTKKKKNRPISQFPVIRALDKERLLAHEGQIVTVFGLVTDIKHAFTKYKDPYVFINFEDWWLGHFKITIWSEGLEYLSSRGVDIDNYKDRFISFTGLMEEYNTWLMEEYQGVPTITFSPERADKINIVFGTKLNRLEHDAKVWKEEEKVNFDDSTNNHIDIIPPFILPWEEEKENDNDSTHPSYQEKTEFTLNSDYWEETTDEDTKSSNSFSNADYWKKVNHHNSSSNSDHKGLVYFFIVFIIVIIMVLIIIFINNNWNNYNY